MSNAKDLADLKAQLDEGIAKMKESFGVLDHDLEALAKADAAFHHAALDSYQSDDNHMRDEAATSVLEELRNQLHATLDADKKFAEAHTHLTHDYHDDLAKVDAQLHEHHAHVERFVGVMGTFASNIGLAIEEVETAKSHHAHEVQNLSHSLSELAQHALAAATDTDHGVRQAQADAIDKAMHAMQALMTHHTGEVLPQLFEQTGSKLLQETQELGQHVTRTADTLHQELEGLLHDIAAFAAQQVHDKIEAKFSNLMSEALTFLSQEITESVAVTLSGAATTTVMSPLLPELAALKIATAAIKEAIEVFKALESIF